jgi:potassium/chloride transporter 9
MISRALGPEFGGSIGTLFFFANAIGSGFNAVGLVEAFLNNYGKSELNPSGLPQTRWFKFLYGSTLNVVSLIIVLLGANLFSYAVTFIYLVRSFGISLSVHTLRKLVNIPSFSN